MISAKLNDFTELIKFGLKLLREEEVEEIKRDCADGDLKKLGLKILEKWKSSKDHAIWDDVVEALRKIGQNEAATKIEKAKQKRPAGERGKL